MKKIVEYLRGTKIWAGCSKLGAWFASHYKEGRLILFEKKFGIVVVGAVSIFISGCSYTAGRRVCAGDLETVKNGQMERSEYRKGIRDCAIEFEFKRWGDSVIKEIEDRKVSALAELNATMDRVEQAKKELAEIKIKTDAYAESLKGATEQLRDFKREIRNFRGDVIDGIIGGLNVSIRQRTGDGQ